MLFNIILLIGISRTENKNYLSNFSFFLFVKETKGILNIVKKSILKKYIKKKNQLKTSTILLHI